ncbi:hypothetical protein MPTK1_4g10280 [Marchantia polymorpha subsp. ruderalis]|uniref:Uncharacterized protein n=2 Tax=Marchantia polymorpha TaxID=3197 RepID=A0AAF6B8E6_MARPO|nr:hypothetical protein MARPO_0011s0015 [Marchantia polymorpha]BBN08280.1 hypothetical protein Mp_4g10280 [Marchantia polymorpha subsp. ruderalis]|eukprot:PTQ46316.1 hypothetical protein MARPO_0011s0015 [Marchantia polymorpha]
MARCSSVSRKVYGAVLVLMFLVSLIESANCDSSESMPAVEKMSASASVRTEALAEAKNSQLQATEIAGVKTVARRGSPGRTNGVSRACASMPTLVTAAVVMVVVNLAAALS